METHEAAERAKTAVEELGDSSEEIAEALRERGVRGERRNPKACPIARFLNTEVNEGFRFANCGTTLYIDDTPFVPIESFGPDSPLAVFTSDFDSGEYPELMEEEDD